MQRAEFSIKQKIRREIWDNGWAKTNSEEGKAINAYLKQIESEVFHYYRDMLAGRKMITADGLKHAYLGIQSREHSLMSLIEYHNTQLKDTLAWGTMKNYSTTQKYVKRFLKSHHGKSDMYLTELKYKFIVDFEYFLRNWKPIDHQKPLGNNGVMKHIERFRKMINLAICMEWLDKDPFAKYKQKFERVDKEFLWSEELKAIEGKELKIVRLQRVQDLFVFSCYTGLAYIDVMQLTPSNITMGIDGKQWLITNRQKTSNPVRVPLLPHALEVIDKYKWHPKALHDGTLFTAISNQKLNSYLKEIADLCGIEKNITFYLARDTFATTVTLTNGVPIESVSKMLGHSKIAIHMYPSEYKSGSESE